MTRHDEANARALKAALMGLRLGKSTRGHGFPLVENEAEEIVALAVQHLLKSEDRP